MENPAPVKTTLRVNINCCEGCPIRVKKLLLKVTGVHTVDVDPEERLVYVKGNADTKLLIKAIGKRKKKAEVVPNEETQPEGQSMDQNGHLQYDYEYCYVCRTNGFDERVCRDPHCRTYKRSGRHNFPVFQPMPPNAFYPYAPPAPSAPEMRFGQDEFRRPSRFLHGYGRTYLRIPRRWM